MDYKQSVNSDILKLVWGNSNDALFALDYNGRILSANPAFTKILGWSEEDLQNPENLLVFQHEDQGYEQLLCTLKSGKNVPCYFTKRKRKDGKVLEILASYGAVNEGKILAVGMYKDFTEQMENQRKLELSKESYRNILEQFPFAIFVIKDDNIIYANQSGMDIVGAHPKNEIIGSPIWKFIQIEHQPSLKKSLWKGNQSAILGKIKRVDGEIRWVEMSVMPVSFEGEDVKQIVVRDVTEEKDYEEKLKYFAYHDPVTGLYNRHYFTKKIKTMVEEAKKNNSMFGVMFIDMDDFKKVNDSFGHEMGDRLLIQFADRLKKNVREEDIVCRLGGDEFLILIKNIRGKQTLEEIATRLQKAFQVPYQLGDESVVVISSIGISMFPLDGLDDKTLISRADQALYQAKKHRKGFQFYEGEGFCTE